MVKVSLGNFLMIGLMAIIFILLFKSMVGVMPDSAATDSLKKVVFAI